MRSYSSRRARKVSGGAIHSYYITAVDTHYKESLMVGPVLGGP